MSAAGPAIGEVRRELADEVFRAFLAAGRTHAHFARAKILRDPIYLDLLRHDLLGGGGTLIDLGCGRGILLAAAVAARRLLDRGAWPDGWPDPPDHARRFGVEISPRAARVARLATAGEAEIVVEDIARCRIPLVRTVVLIDVLHYLARAEQDAVLVASLAAIERDGAVLIREADAGAGLRFGLTRAAERLRAIGRGRPGQRMAYRSAEAWRGALGALGADATVRASDAGTPFANVLLRATRRRR